MGLRTFISLNNYINATEKRTAKAAIQRNAFHAHPENLLLAMLVDDDPDMCQMRIQTCAKSMSNSYIWTIKKQYFEDVEIEEYSDDEASGDEAEDEEYTQDESVWPFNVPTLML